MTKVKIWAPRPERRDREDYSKRRAVVDAVEVPSRVRAGARVSPAREAKELGVVPPLRGESTTPAGKEKNTTDDVLRSASQLSAKDQKELLARLSLAVNEKAGDPRDLDMWAVALLDALGAAAGRGAAALPGVMVVKGLVASPTPWGHVRDFMEAAGFAELTVQERLACYRLIARLAVQDAQEFAEYSGAPMGPKLVANRLNNLAGIFERSFPGYLRSGLGRFVVRALVRQG